VPPAAPPTIDVLAADPELAAGLGDAGRAGLGPLVVPRLDLAIGPWSPPAHAGGAPAVGFLLVDGLITRELAIGGRRSAMLMGPGDVVDPWPPGDELLPREVALHVEEPGVAAVLGEAFIAAAGRIPALAVAVHRRRAAQLERACAHAALAGSGPISVRVLSVLWLLAERWGRVTPDGIALALPLTHAELGRLVGAQRSTVTLALRQLQAAGRVTGGSGRWVLHGDAAAALAELGPA